MSYVVNITSLPLPDNEEEAWDCLVEIDAANEGTFGTPGPKMEELYRRLSKRYPCITEATESPWCDGPLLDNFGRDIATIGVIYSRATEAMLFIIEVATQLGCTVLDGQDDKIYRPVNWQPAIPSSADSEQRERRPWWKIW